MRAAIFFLWPSRYSVPIPVNFAGEVGQISSLSWYGSLAKMNALSITQAEYNDLFGDSDSEDENFMGFESMDSDDDSENGDPDTTDDENQNQPHPTLHEIETGAFADSWLKDFA